MRSDGRPLPDISETAALRRLGLIRSDALPDLAARWLAADLLDTPLSRMLAGHDRHDPWGLDQLFDDSMGEAGAEEPTEIPDIERVAVDWIVDHIHTDADTRAAVRLLATVYLNYEDLECLGQFNGLDDEWTGGWGRVDADLAADAREAMLEILSRPTS